MENRPETLLLAEQNNCFLVDWLTVVFHGIDPAYVKWLLGLDGTDIPWNKEEKFRNGYPVHYTWNGITISYGADDLRYYSDSIDKNGCLHRACDKVRNDMGVCLNLSGTGCRSFETYGNGNWLRLLRFIFNDPEFAYQRDHTIYRSNITRLDIAYDDHIGILDIQRMELDVRDRSYKSKSTYSERVLSDDQKKDIQGISLYFGSPTSPVRIRIYDKAAERGFKDRHWVRVELQLRDERAKVFAAMFLQDQHLGRIASGVLRNYLCFLNPTNDTNKSRWPLAPYWDRLLLDMEKISLWITPGEEYNFAKTEHWLLKQWGQAMRVLDVLYGSDYLIDRYRELYPVEDLSLKYQRVIDTYRLTNPSSVQVAAESVWDSTAVKWGFVDQLSFIDSLPCDFEAGL